MGTRFQYAGGAPTLALLSTISPTDLSFTSSTSASAYPDGSIGPFVVLINATEKVKCTSRSGNVFTVAASGRGFDGTTAATHQAGQTIDHGFDATSATDFADHVYNTGRDDHTQYHTDARHLTSHNTFAVKAFRAHNNNPVTIPSGVFTTVTWDTEDEDDDNAHVAASGVFTVPRAGKYLVHAQVFWTTPSTGRRDIRLLGNASDVMRGLTIPDIAASGVIGHQMLCGVVTVNAADTLALQVQQTSGGNTTVSNGVVDFISIIFLGA